MTLKLSNPESTQKKLTFGDLGTGTVFLSSSREPGESGDPFMKVELADYDENDLYAVLLSSGESYSFDSKEDIDEVLPKGTIFVIE
jgi:hypothetical protein